MKRSAIDVYVCPQCKGALRLTVRGTKEDEVLEGTLTCRSCASAYPIVRGVPRFVAGGAYAASFGRQWNWFRTVQIDSMHGGVESRQTFASTTAWTTADVQGQRVLDAGVGAGRFAEVAADLGGEVYGVDLTAAIDAAYANIGARPNVHLAQADIFALPFANATFDRAYSIGVLHHTPDPAAAFEHVAATVKDDGQLAVYVYARYGPGHHCPDLIRTVTTRLPKPIMLGLTTAAIPLYYVYRLPIVGTVLRNLLPISMLPHWRWRWLDTFDWYTPKYQFKYLYPEVFRWFQQSGFRDVQIFDEPIRMRGLKAAAEPSHERYPTSRVVAS